VSKRLERTSIFTFFFIAILSFLAFTLLNRANQKMIHEDEVMFLERGKFFDWYVAGDFKREEWQGFESYDIPKLVEFFYGLVLRTYYRTTVVSYLTEIGFFENGELNAGSWKTTETRGKCCVLTDMPDYVLEKSPPILVARRFGILFFTIPLLALLYFIGKEANGNIFGLTSMTVIGMNSLFLESMTAAMAESLLWFFFFLFLYISLFYFQKAKKSYVQTSILGLTAGLATSVKLNGTILVMFFFLALFLTLAKKAISFRQFIYHAFIFSIVSFAIFFFINPYIWKNPILNSIKIVEHRYLTFHLLATSDEFSHAALNSNGKRLTAVFRRTLSPYADYVNFNSRKWSGTYEMPVDLLLVAISIFLLLKQQFKNRNLLSLSTLMNTNFMSKRISPKEKIHKETVVTPLNILLCFLLIIFTLTTVNIPLDWSRYYLPYIFCWGFLQSYVISFCIIKITE
jgi:hypothetical protein